MISVLQSEITESLRSTSDAQYSGVWMETLSHLDPKYGGLTAVVPALATELQKRNLASVRLSAFCTEDEHTAIPANMTVKTTVWPSGHARLLMDGRVKKRFAESVELVDGVHLHGLWDASTYVVAKEASKRSKPFVISAHGMLEPWALAQGAAKKRIYGALIERPTMRRAAWLHALTAAEADNYRQYGLTGPIAIIPNAVEPPQTIDSDRLESLLPQIAGKRVVLFLGRLHVKKGIDLLLQAWSGLRADHPDTVVVLAGPSEAKYLGLLQERVRQLGLIDSVLFTGMLDSEAKWSALCRAHVFVLASYSEGLSVAALEALSVGTPVIVSEHCHMREVMEENCGWQIKADADTLAQALRSSLEASRFEQSCRSHNARRLATTRFSWDVICAQMAELYRCVLGGGTPALSEYREALR